MILDEEERKIIVEKRKKALAEEKLNVFLVTREDCATLKVEGAKKVIRLDDFRYCYLVFTSQTKYDLKKYLLKQRCQFIIMDYNQVDMNASKEMARILEDEGL